MDQAAYYFYAFVIPLVLLVVAGIFLYKWYFAKKYTRERFAFYSIGIFTWFLITLVSLLLARNQILDLIVDFLRTNGVALKNYQQLDFLPTAVFILICASLLFYLIRSIHHNWDGVLSTRQMNHQETQRQINVVADAFYYWKKHDQIEIYQPQPKSKPEVFSPYKPETRPWYLRAANLFNLLDQQYRINIDRDWYREEECFISRYGQDDSKIAILCLEKRPSDERLRDFFDFLEKRGGQFEKRIVAIAGKGPESKGLQLGKEVHIRFETELLDKLISFQHYKDFIFDYFDENELENSDLKMADMYVPLGGHTVNIEKGKLNKAKAMDSVEAYILEWAKGKRRLQTEQLAILGDYGQGKTVLMHKIVYEMLRNPDQYSRIPILIELRGLSPRNDDELSILSHWAKRFKAKAEALWELHLAGKLLLILDGFDEMDLVGDTEMLFNHFTQLWALAQVPNAQIIVAGRPNLFADDEQRRMALGIQEARTDLPYAQAVYLDKLREGQIELVLRKAKDETRKGILTALERAPNSSFAEIITRPSTLFQLSSVWDEELDKRLERLNSATVIGSFINKTYERQQKKGTTVLTAFERSYFMQGIAVGMMLENAYTNQIKHKDLERLVTLLWNNYPPKLSPYGDAMQGHRALDFLPLRMQESPDALQTILKDVRAGGILVQDLSGRDVFKFAHKSYMEYLVSAFFSGFVLQNEHELAGLMMVNSIGKALNFTNTKLKGTSDIELFTAELISSQFETRSDSDNSLLQKDLAEKNSKKIYKALIIKSYPISGRFFHSLKALLTLHPDMTSLLVVLIFFLLSFCLYLLTTDESTRNMIVIFNGVLCWIWVVILLKHRKLKDSLEHRHDFLSKFRLYLMVCDILNYPARKIPNKLILAIKEENDIAKFYKFSLAVFSLFFAMEGLLIGAWIAWFAIMRAKFFVDIYSSVGISAFLVAGTLREFNFVSSFISELGGFIGKTIAGCLLTCIVFNMFIGYNAGALVGIFLWALMSQITIRLIREEFISDDSREKN